VCLHLQFSALKVLLLRVVHQLLHCWGLLPLQTPLALLKHLQSLPSNTPTKQGAALPGAAAAAPADA
jgi:hypothetical protein